MEDVTLVIMAAGIGSRFGGGIKQLAEVGPNGEIIVDYSIHDALEAGFNKVVFVIRKDLEKDFKEIIGNRVEKIIKTEYVYQELTDIPEQFKDKLEAREKPWGTGQAVLCCKDVVHEPFLVINADDYYGKEAYREAYAYLTEENVNRDEMDMCMVGFVLGNTLSDNGTVTRGICTVSADHELQAIEETYEIERRGEYAVAVRDGKEIKLDLMCPVSMNMWGLYPDFFEVLCKGFTKFLEDLKPEDIKREYLLPGIVGKMLEKNEVRITVLESRDKWFGVTYKEDRDSVVEAIKGLIEAGEYPDRLY